MHHAAAKGWTRVISYLLENKADPNAGGEIQPIFATRRVTTALTCRVGVPTLLSTLSAPHATGIAEADGDGKVSVTFAHLMVPSTREFYASRRKP